MYESGEKFERRDDVTAVRGGDGGSPTWSLSYLSWKWGLTSRPAMDREDVSVGQELPTRVNTAWVYKVVFKVYEVNNCVHRYCLILLVFRY